MIVPTLATIVVGTNGLVGHIATASNADRARTLANLSEVSGVLVHDLQNERADAAMLLAARDQPSRAKILAAYTQTQEQVDAARRPYSQHRTALADLPPKFRELLGNIDANLSELPTVRSQVVNGKLKLSDAALSYQALLTDLVGIRDSAAQLAGETTLSDRMRATAAVSRIKDYLSQERVVVHEAFSLDRMTPALKRKYIATRTGQDQALQAFTAVATPAEVEAYKDTVSGSVLREADTYEGYLDSKPDESMETTKQHFDDSEWDAAIVGHADLIRKVEAQLDRDMVAQATALRDAVQQRVLVETGLLLGMLLLAILFAWLVARSMARSLRELRHGALSVAQYGLPQAVARLRDPALTTQLSPAQVAAQIAEPLPVRSMDEFGQVTEAFNAVHLEAVRTAAEQAALRSSVATMFVNLARRSQILVDRLIGHLDRLERGEEDPDRLAELFQLDHLATRMRRNDENLLVLAGADSTRVQREPAALIDVLRAAQSEVEHYTRIEFGVVDRDIEVAAHAVNDLVHLVAELFDNATAFSPPDSHVVVEARRVGDRAVLYVEDRGIGVSPDQLADLNERLATPPMVDVTVSRMMGLVVVARLASRHGVKVELRPAAERGTIADVTLPTAVLVPRALGTRLQPQAGQAVPAGPSRQQPIIPAQRSFAAPLALESGPAATGPRPVEFGPPPDGRRVGAAPAPNGGGLLGPAASARAMPAWSDLTGALPGGDDMFTPRQPNGRPVEPLPQRRGSEHRTVEGEVTGSRTGPTIPRQVTPETHAGGRIGPRPGDGMPTGHMAPPSAAPPAVPPVISGPPVISAPPFGPPTPPISSAPPSGAPASAPPGSARPASAPPVPSGPPYAGPPSAESEPEGMLHMPIMPPGVPPPTSAPPDVVGPPPPVIPAPAAGPAPEAPARPGASGQAVPPAWPPAGPDRDSAGAPQVPEKFAAALDMTAELPKVRPSGEEPDGPRGGEPAAARPYVPPRPAERRVAYVDETMELPIFRELESAWFHTHRSAAPDTSAAAGIVATETQPDAGGDQYVTVDASARTGVRAAQSKAMGTANAAMANPPMQAPAGAEAPTTQVPRTESVEPAWHTVADEGWRAAAEAAEMVPTDTTEAGLPKRVPMAQLVPGGVDKGASATQRRTPEAVRGLLSAYHRGVQRGRTQPKDDDSTDPAATSAGQQSAQAGKEHDE
jgi:signal transduction histidine kinase